MILVLILLCFVLAGGVAFANPQGLKVVTGSATVSQKGNTLQITTSQGAVLHWNSFNIGSGQTTIFKEPSSTSIVFNNIGSASPSKIFGSLQANGIVVLENLNGFYFGPNAMVKTGGLVVTTAAIDPWSTGGGMGWSFSGPPVKTPIVNYGTLETTGGGSLYLIAKNIENKGTIEAQGGKVGLVAGQEVLLSERADGLGLSAPVELPAGSVDNAGNIIADAGQVLLQAQTVNNSGTIQANSVRQKNGVIELYASGDVQLAGTSVIQANGDAGKSAGGNIAIKAGGTFSDAAGSQISATGGAAGGNGGAVEVSAPNIGSLESSVDAEAQKGWSEGSFTLDPANIELGSATTGGSSGVTYMDVNTAFKNIGANLTLEASQNITLDAGTTWNLSTSTGETAGNLYLEAGGNIILGKQATGGGASIVDPNNWSMTLEAGYSGSSVTAGTGTVQLYNTSSITTAAGSIEVEAGESVLLGSGGIVTGIANGAVMNGQGGNVTVTALAGNVDGGTTKSGFNFKSPTLGAVDPALGGISTASGGNVTIVAGGNITDEPTLSGDEDAGIGAFGSNPGNVTLKAGGEVTGHYVVADGVGTISAFEAGTASANLSLSLIKGAWDVNALDDIVLQEARNPNGVFNFSRTATPLTYLFDYDPMASVTLDAGDNVTITGATDTKLPRDGNSEGLIFPPILNIEAGAGGVTLDSDVTLFPSAEGTLNIATTGGGSIEGNDHTVDISDSTRTQYGGSISFVYADSEENAFLHLNDPNPAQITASGSIDDLNVDSPKPLDLYAAVDIKNSAANIQNLHASDVSTISAGGQIIDQVNFAVIELQAGDVPNLAALLLATTPTIVLPDGATAPNPQYISALGPLSTSFAYDAASGGLVYTPPNASQPQLTQAQYNALLHIHFISQTDLNSIFTQSQKIVANVPTGESYDINGPGTLEITAASMSLGFEGGIVSKGIVGDQQVESITPRGADLDISVGGDLSMAASSIEAQYGGNISITTGGQIDVGSTLLGNLVTQAENGQLFGIVSLWQGNISVVADGDINVAGSRIASYDGGNVFVESLDGDVNAGVGGAGATTVQKPYVGKNGSVLELYDVIPGSGILATSYPELVPGENVGEIGNITVETPNGDIIASKGGIVQLALGPAAQNATINLSAGTKNPDGTVESIGNVDAEGSGVVGGQVNISATGDINGLVVASVGANVSALQNVNATVLSQGAVSVSAGQTVSGTIVGVGSVSVSGATDVAAAFSATSVSANGSVSGAAVASGPTASSSASAAATSQQVNQATQPASDVAANSDDDELKKKKKSQLMEYVGRVTVLLPE